MKEKQEAAKQTAIEKRVVENFPRYKPDLLQACWYSDGFDDGYSAGLRDRDWVRIEDGLPEGKHSEWNGAIKRSDRVVVKIDGFAPMFGQCAHFADGHVAWSAESVSGDFAVIAWMLIPPLTKGETEE